MAPLRPIEVSASPRAAPAPGDAKLSVRGLDAWFGAHQVLTRISIDVAARQVTAIMGPSGCGKSTLIRCLNRLHELVPGARVSGEVRLDGEPIYGGIDPVLVRRRIGMVFQRPNPFPTLSIHDNVAAGLRLTGMRGKELGARVDRSLRRAALWDEVKDRLDRPATSLSGGQQQRLCIARALAVEPEVLLMDEPCSALDPIATARIEELMMELATDTTLVIVTHNMQQAARVADTTAFFLMGELVEHGPSDKVFTHPEDKRTEDYITGRFG
ncbi:phosphate ABC transporter ATP-binding protein [bacterium]|nr:phosphate ABC transporter ATP-binding protein [bacterium]